MKRFAIVASVFLFAGFVVPAMAQSPGQSNAFGKTLDEWMALYMPWSIGNGAPDHEGDVKFLQPIVEGGEWVHEDRGWMYYNDGDFALKPGEKFAYSMLGLYADRYADGTEDQPSDPAILDLVNFIKTAEIEFWIDGKRVISSDDKDFAQRWYGPVYFDPPFVFDEPDEWGGVAATWAEGYGFVHEPLSKGAHTMTEVLWYPDYGQGNTFTWHVTVK